MWYLQIISELVTHYLGIVIERNTGVLRTSDHL